MHGGTPHIPPVLNFSTLTKSFTGALPRKANTSQLGFIVFQGEMMGSGKGGWGGGCYSAAKPHIVCSGKYQSFSLY